ncbi:oligosaccharide flippase family protein [Agriterribacter sp.]|uniref:oligosaccharide flippase family protein n=1 Tax=Agriterribacter sp. TaxID=2821509 RepID=UPI002B705CDB|nr:oligosaccharide flippase family protein [Agriterribacter sp.]HRP54744.1 oligosaccharide flippase family protein [Agriterribacter sp.]
MYKKFFSYAGIEGFAKGLNWLTIALLPLFLPTDQYGVVGLLVAIEGIMNTVLTLGQGRAILRHTITFKEKMLPYALQLNILSVLGVFLICIIISLFREEIMGISFFPHLLFLFISLLFYNLSGLMISHALATDNPAFFRKSRLWYAVTKLVAVIGICFYTGNGLGYIYGSLTAGIIFIFLFYKDIFSHFNFKRIFVFDKNLKFLFVFGLPLIFHALSGNILSYADRFFVEGYLNKSQLGIYTFAYSLGSSIFFFYGSVGTYFEPLVYKFSADKKKYHAILKFYLTFVLMCASLFSIAILIGTKYFAFHFISEDYLSGFTVLPIVLGAHLMMPFYHISNYELTVLNKTAFIAFSTIGSAILNILLNIFFIPKWGITGAAFSTLLTYIFLALAGNAWAIKASGISRNYLKYIAILFLFVNAAVLYANFMIHELWLASGGLFALFIVLSVLSIRQMPTLKMTINTL